MLAVVWATVGVWGTVGDLLGWGLESQWSVSLESVWAAFLGRDFGSERKQGRWLPRFGCGWHGQVRGFGSERKQGRAFWFLMAACGST